MELNISKVGDKIDCSDDEKISNYGKMAIITRTNTKFAKCEQEQEKQNANRKSNENEND